MFKDPFSFNGRIRRMELILSYIICYLSYFIILFLQDGDESAIYGLLFIPVMWFYLAQRAKRCHDLGKSGWWQIIPFYFFWMLFESGETWANQYGENPKQLNLHDPEKDMFEQPFSNNQ
jgi:uncharacterized membrane protein YhaH (DUF805 family)